MHEVRVRFAPSPTGYLHVGGARTALFNWLFARKHKGRFILRIEDTDIQRSSEEMIEAIIDGLLWLGLNWDEGPYFQSRFIERHKEKALKLLEERKAYRCFCKLKDLMSRKEEAEKKGLPWKYDRRCLELPESIVQEYSRKGIPSAIRFKVPWGRVTYNDFVHGKTEFDDQVIEDFVLLRSDGRPTYHLSVVSDDIDMHITHVIRGDDHISNTPKQILLYKALGAEPPVFAHLPLILGKDKKRLSKRHGAISILEYKKAGYLPEALFNFLALLGWSPGNDRQFLSKDELIDLFSFEGIGKASSVFDVKKLEWLNSQYLSRKSAEELRIPIREALREADLWKEEYETHQKEWFLKTIELLKPRAKKVTDFSIDNRAFFSDDFPYEEQAVKKFLKGEQIENYLKELVEHLAAFPDERFVSKDLERVIRSLAEKLGIKAAQLIHPTRVALTGKAVSPGIFDVMEIIGKNKSLARMKRLITYLETREKQ